MEADFAAFGSPLCGEVKRFCRRMRETYREIKEDLTPYKDDRYYRLDLGRIFSGCFKPQLVPLLFFQTSPLGPGIWGKNLNDPSVKYTARARRLATAGGED
ncbi:transmembrane protein 181 [Grus japonensis]|uniref:Transmembrane protein 181 n=1 Tax=Grus japonensis TaxID=30415 RepID=A0ABC9WNF6_GRUJA